MQPLLERLQRGHTRDVGADLLVEAAERLAQAFGQVVRLQIPHDVLDRAVRREVLEERRGEIEHHPQVGLGGGQCHGVERAQEPYQPRAVAMARRQLAIVLVQPRESAEDGFDVLDDASLGQPLPGRHVCRHAGPFRGLGAHQERVERCMDRRERIAHGDRESVWPGSGGLHARYASATDDVEQPSTLRVRAVRRSETP